MWQGYSKDLSCRGEIMTYEEVVIWIDSNMPSHFTDYKDLKEFRDDYNKLKNNESKLGTGKRADSFKERMDEWLDEKWDSKTTYSDVQEGIENSKVEDVRGMEYEDAKSELETIKEQNIYTAGTIAKIEKIVEEKGIDTTEIIAKIESAESQADIDAIGTRGQIRRTYGEKADDILERLDTQAGEIASLEEEVFESLFDRIGEATSIGELNALQREADRVSISDRSRGELTKLINEARVEVE